MLGTVRTVTYQAVLIGLALNVGLVAVKAGRFHAMLCGIYASDMTSSAAHLGIVLAGILFHLLAFRIVVAYLTGNNLLAALVLYLLLHTLKRNLKWSMRVSMTLQAVGECLAMLQAMTPGTFWHYILVIVLCGDVGVELGVTL
jgi:hypothetical protein